MHRSSFLLLSSLIVSNFANAYDYQFMVVNQTPEKIAVVIGQNEQVIKKFFFAQTLLSSKQNAILNFNNEHSLCHFTLTATTISGHIISTKQPINVCVEGIWIIQ